MFLSFTESTQHLGRDPERGESKDPGLLSNQGRGRQEKPYQHSPAACTSLLHGCSCGRSQAVFDLWAETVSADLGQSFVGWKSEEAERGAALRLHCLTQVLVGATAQKSVSLDQLRSSSYMFFPIPSACICCRHLCYTSLIVIDFIIQIYIKLCIYPLLPSFIFKIWIENLT